MHGASSYKTDKTTKGKDWESVRTRYEDLEELFIERYPTNDEADPEQFPNSKNTSVFTEKKIIAKFKSNLGIEKLSTLEDEAEGVEL